MFFPLRVAGVHVIRCARVTAAALALLAGSNPVFAARAAAKPGGDIQIITGQGVASSQGQATGKSKRAGKLKLKRRGQPWEVRIVSADGREQIYRGYRERAAKRETGGEGHPFRDGEERRGLRVMRLQLPAPP